MKKIIYTLLIFTLSIYRTVTVAQSTVIQADRITVPKMTTAAKNSLLNKVEGNMVYDTDLGQFSYWTGSAWVNFGNTVTSVGWEQNGTNLTTTNTGNVGIGTSTIPDSKLHVMKASAGVVSPVTYTVATLENNNSAFLSILTPSSSIGGIKFGSPTDNERGFLNYQHNNDKMLFGTSGSYQMTIRGDGNVGIGTTNPESKLDVRGSFRIEEKYDFLNTNNQVFDSYDREGKSYIFFQAQSNAYTTTIKGFSAPTSSTSGLSNTFGTILVIVNYQGELILKNDAATNINERIRTHTSADIRISDSGGAILIYSDQGWRVISHAQ